MAEPKHFLVILEARPTFLADITEAEQQIVAGHYQYLQNLLSDGKLVLAGRRIDTPFGVEVLEAASFEEAQALVADDPAVRQGTFRAQVHPFSLALERARP